MIDDPEPIEGELVNPPVPLRLTKHPEETVRALELAFQTGYNITEACLYAGISRTLYYEWLADDDNFSYRMSVAQGSVTIKAKHNVIRAIRSGDTKISLDYLKLRDPDFKPKLGVEPIDPALDETRNKIKEFLNDPNDSGSNEGSAELTAGPESGTTEQVADPPTDI